MKLPILKTGHTPHIYLKLYFFLQTEQEMCYACGQLISDRYLLHVNGRSWHPHCLRCSICQAALDRQPSCFIKDDHVYCRTDYVRWARASRSNFYRILLSFYFHFNSSNAIRGHPRLGAFITFHHSIVILIIKICWKS